MEKMKIDARKSGPARKNLVVLDGEVIGEAVVAVVFVPNINNADAFVGLQSNLRSPAIGTLFNARDFLAEDILKPGDIVKIGVGVVAIATLIINVKIEHPGIRGNDERVVAASPVGDRSDFLPDKLGEFLLFH